MMPSSQDDSKTQAIPTPATSEDAVKNHSKKDKHKPPKEKKPKRESDRPSSSPFLFFAGSFLGGLLLFSVIAYFLLPVLGISLPFMPAQKQETAATVVQPNTEPTARYNVQDRVSMTVFITDDDNHLQTATVVMIQPDTMEVSVLGLPAELAVGTESETDTLYHRFEGGNASGAQMALIAYFGKSIDYHLTLSYSDAESLFQALRQQLIVTLPMDVNEQSADNRFSIHLSAGERALTPSQTAHLLEYNNWQGGISERAQQHATFIANFVRQYLVSTRDVTDDYEAIYKHGEWNLSGEHFRVMEPMLSEMAMKNAELRFVIHYTEGHYEGAGDALRFTPGPQSIDSVKATLK